MAGTLRDQVPLQKRKIVKKGIGGALAALVIGGFLSIFVVASLYSGYVQEPASAFFASVRAHRGALLLVWLLLIASLVCYAFLYYIALKNNTACLTISCP